ncbi:MAG: hypothetical protein Q7R93_02345 [bacterium]|nr:hypothetical protein [bacterium]
MKVDFYGTKIAPPPQAIALAFGSKEIPVLLKGGQGTSYRSGNIILKPSEGIKKQTWTAEAYQSLPESPEVRFPRPIKSINGTWVHEGYIALSFLEGEHANGHYAEKLSASIAFHKLLQGIPKPDFVGLGENSWSIGDLVAWDKLGFNYDQEFMDLYNQIKPHLKQLTLPEQLVHGDLSGNLLVHPTLPVAIIDYSHAWAPNGFAEGIMLADVIAWENASPKELECFKQIPNIEQFAWRGILRRITEQAEHIKHFDKDKDQALGEARAFQKAIDYLKKNYT